MIAILSFLLVPGPAALAHGTAQVIPLMTPASNTSQQGFIRVINRSKHGGTVNIHAIDDSGTRFGPVALSLDAEATAHFNSEDLERGNSSKGLSVGVGDGQGNWRLELSSDLDFEALAYIRTGNGFVTSMHDTVAEESPRRYRVPFFNPGSNLRQQSRLRLINSGAENTEVTITGLDDRGMPPPEGGVGLMLPSGEAAMVTARQLELGDDELTGRLGDGTGKWTLVVTAEHAIQVMNLLLSEDGNLANLSRTPYEPHSSSLPSDECDDELVVEGDDEGHSSFDSAVLLGNLTKVATVRAREGTVDGTNDEDGYYRFTLDDTRTIRVELRNLTRNADLYLRNVLGERMCLPDSCYTESRNDGTLDESVAVTLDAGTYFIHVDAEASGTVGYQLRYGNDSIIPGRRIESAVDLGDLTDFAEVGSREDQVNATRNETCRFRRTYYRVTLDDTRVVRVELLNLTRDADLFLRDSIGERMCLADACYTESRNDGTLDESVAARLDAGTYFIHVEAETNSTTDTEYQLRYSNDSAIAGRTIESAFNLGNLSGVAVTRTRAGRVNSTRNETRLFRRAYYRFVLDDTRTIRVELRKLTRNADLYLRNVLGERMCLPDSCYTESRNDGTLDESIAVTLDAGTYFIHVEAETNSTTDTEYVLRYGPGG